MNGLERHRESEGVEDPGGACIEGQTPDVYAHFVHIPGGCSIEEDQIGGGRQQRAHQSLTIAPEPVELPERVAPAVQLPGLQRDARDPAGPLFHRRPEIARKVAARGDERAVVFRNGNEDLRAPQPMQPKAVLVVFGETFRLEDAIGMGGGQPVERAAREARAHSAGRQKAAQERPRRHVSALVFGELVAVDAVEQLAQRCRKGQHGNLHHVVVLAVVIDPAQLFGMKEILGVVGHHDFEADAVFRFEKDHVLENPVEIVGFRGGAVMRTHRHVNIGEAGVELPHGGERLLIVGIDSDEKIAAVVARRHHVVLDHVPDDAVLAPERHKDRDSLVGSVRQIGFRGRFGPPPAQESGEEPSIQAGNVEN